MATLERDETHIVDGLVRHGGLSRREATLAVVMTTRAHARPRKQITEIASQYPGLEGSSNVEEAIAGLMRRGWLQESVLDDIVLVHQAPDLRAKIAEAVGDASVEGRLSWMRAGLEEFVRVVGPMKDGHVYRSFLDMLRCADREISLPMLVTPPYDETVSVLRERSLAGVRVRILLGSPRLAKTLRGHPLAKVSADRIRQWRTRAQSIPGMEVRLSGSAEDMRIATSVLVDGRIARFDIYDPGCQRSLEGVMIEVESPTGYNLNFVTLVQDAFESAWAAARPVSPWGIVGWEVRQRASVMAGAGALLAAAVPVPIASWREVGIGIASGLWAEELIQKKPWLRLRRQ